MSDCLAFIKAWSWIDVQRKSFRVLRRGRNGARFAASSFVLEASWLVRPMKDRRSMCRKVSNGIDNVLTYMVAFRGKG